MSNAEEQIKRIEQALHGLIGQPVATAEYQLKKAIQKCIQNAVKVDPNVKITPKKEEPGVYNIEMTLPKWLADKLEADKS